MDIVCADCGTVLVGCTRAEYEKLMRAYGFVLCDDCAPVSSWRDLLYDLELEEEEEQRRGSR